MIEENAFWFCFYFDLIVQSRILIIRCIDTSTGDVTPFWIVIWLNERERKNSFKKRKRVKNHRHNRSTWCDLTKIDFWPTMNFCSCVPIQSFIENLMKKCIGWAFFLPWKKNFVTWTWLFDVRDGLIVEGERVRIFGSLFQWTDLWKIYRN